LVLSNNELRGVPQLKLLGTGQILPPTKQQQSESDGTSFVNRVSTPFVAVPNSRKSRPASQGVKLAKHVKFPSGTRLSVSPFPPNDFSELLTTNPQDRHYNTPRYPVASRARTVLAIPSIDAQDSDDGGRHSYKPAGLTKHARSLSNPELYSELSFVAAASGRVVKPEDQFQLNLASTASPTELGTTSQTDDRVWSSSLAIGGAPSVVSNTTNLSPFPRLRVLNLSHNLVGGALLSGYTLDSSFSLACQWGQVKILNFLKLG